MRGLAVAAAILALLLPCLSWAQTVGCDEGVIRLGERGGTVQICSALAAQVPGLKQQLQDAIKALGDQRTQLRELTRLVKGLNGVSSGIGQQKQGEMLQNLSTELTRAQRAGDERTRQSVEGLNDQLEAFRDQLLGALSNQATTSATSEALRGNVGDAVARLELRSASRQLDEVTERLKQLQSDMTTVKSGVTIANEKLDKISAAVDPSRLGDRCADLSCAISEGASMNVLRRLFEKGARLPGNPQQEGELLKDAALGGNPDRLQVLSLLAQHGLDLSQRIHVFLVDRTKLSTRGAAVAQDFVLAGRVKEGVLGSMVIPTGSAVLDDWNTMAGFFLRSAGGLQLIELAAIMGDSELFRYLSDLKLPPPKKELVGIWQKRREGTFGARVTIDPQTMVVKVTAITP